MNIFTFSGDYVKDKIGGAEYHMELLENEFTKLGHKVFHVHAQPQSVSEYPYVENINNKTIYHLQTTNLIYKKFYTPFLINFLKEVVSKKADVIYIREFHYHFVLSKFCKEFNIPLVREIAHDDHTLRFYKSFYMNIDYKSTIPRIFSDFVMDKNTHFICQSNDQAKILEKNFKQKSKVIYKGHPVNFKTNGKKNMSKIITFLANMRDFKRPELFIELARMNIDKNYKFVMAGPIPPHKKSKLFQFFGELPNLKYLGKLSYNESKLLLSRSSVLVNTSSAEGFSNTFIEAWLLGLPVFSLLANPDNLINCNNLGQSFDDDLKSLSEHLTILLSNTGNYNRLSQHIHNYSIKNFDISTVAKKYLDFFENLNNE